MHVGEEETFKRRVSWYQSIFISITSDSDECAKIKKNSLPGQQQAVTPLLLCNNAELEQFVKAKCKTIIKHYVHQH